MKRSRPMAAPSSLAGVALLALLATTWGRPAQGNGGHMKDDDVIPALQALSIDDDKGLERLAQLITATCRRDAGQVLRLLRSEKEADAQKAAAELIQLGNHAFPTLLDSLHRDKPEDYVWETQLLTDIQLESRRRLLKELEQMLADKRDVKVPEVPPHVEEKFKPRRVCDEAYLMLRRVLHGEEGEEALYLNERAFLNLSDKERDGEIQRWKATRKWIPLAR